MGARSAQGRPARSSDVSSLPMAVYSPDRVNRLRMVLAIVVVIGVLVAVFSAFIVIDGEHRAAGTFAMVVAGLLLGASGTALKLLPDAGRPAKIATVVTGALCLLSGIGLAGTWLAFLLPLIGLGLLFLALIPDEPEAGK
jgi:drug/metabolite transporter (DMT)-like permease